MKRIANTHELTAALKGLLAEASGPNPSRHELAAKLAALSTRVAGSDQPPVLEAAENAVQGIARALGSGWRIKHSDFYEEKGAQGYVGEVWAEDTSYFKLRVEVDAKGVADIDPWVFVNTASAADRMATEVFNKLDVKGDANKILAVLQSAPKVAVEAFEAATHSKAAEDAMFKELQGGLDQVAAMIQPKLAKNNWGLEFNRIRGNYAAPREGKPWIAGSIGLTGLPSGDSNAASKARKIVSDAAKAVSNKGHNMTLPKRVYWSANVLYVPFEMGFAR